MQFAVLGGIERVNRVLWFTIFLNTRLRTSNEIVRRYAQVKTVEIAQELIPHIRWSSTFQIFSGVYMGMFLGEALTPNQYEGTASVWEWPCAVRHCRWYDALGGPWRYWTQVLKLLHVCCRLLLEAGCWATLIFWADIAWLLILCKKANRCKILLWKSNQTNHQKNTFMFAWIHFNRRITLN